MGGVLTSKDLKNRVVQPEDSGVKHGIRLWDEFGMQVTESGWDAEGLPVGRGRIPFFSCVDHSCLPVSD